MFVVDNGTPVPAGPRSTCRRLDPWPAAAADRHGDRVDVVSRRIAVGDGFRTRTLDVAFHYGFPARPRRRPVRAAELARRATGRPAPDRRRGSGAVVTRSPTP